MSGPRVTRCAAPKCKRPATVAGLCAAHYYRKINGRSLVPPIATHRAHAECATACTILDCGRPVIAKDMCWNHYQRDRRGRTVYVYLHQSRGQKLSAVKFGPPEAPYREHRLVLIRWALENNVAYEPNTGCHLWLGDVLSSGYGRVGNHRDPWGGYAHRAVLYFAGVTLAQGAMGLHVRHACDQPACVNRQHLVYGTAQENALDRSRRGRTGITTKFTPDDIRAIRAAHAAGEPTADLAKKHGVGGRHMKLIVGRKLWAWVDNAAVTEVAA